MLKISHYFRILQKKINISTPSAVILGSILISISIVVQGYILRGTTTAQKASADTTLFQGHTIDATDYVEGDTKSKVVVVEYSDPECPYCIQLHPTMKKLRTDYGDKVAFVYRTFPLTQIHPHAFDESRAITCAGVTGGTKGFYAYIDAIFGYKLNKQSNQLPTTGKEDIAKSINLDMKKFTDCMNGTEAGKIVDASTNDGITAGVSGTPTTFVLVRTDKGYKTIANVSGAQTYSYFKAAIQEALTK
jgi:protein-disulfide isomerase